VKPQNGLPKHALRSVAFLFVLLFASLLSWTQEGTPSTSSQALEMQKAIQELQQQVRELRAAVAEMHSEAADYREQTAELRRELKTAQLPPSGPAAGESNSASKPAEAQAGSIAGQTPPTENTASPQGLSQRVASLEDNLQLLTGKVDDQYQTKIESASKYRVRLSGIVLLNLFANRGTTDNQDFPSFALPTPVGGSNGNFGATMRQSEIGLEAFGPIFAGAKTSASVQADFAGGFPYTWNGVNSGYFRLRTASARMDWENTSVVAGQDDLFISPLSPTSFASLAVPAFNYAGNLWGWIPQVRVEHRWAMSDTSNFKIQAGILDNLTGEFPSAVLWSRIPGPGENSGQPAYALRTSWTGNVFGQPLTLGGAGYYSRQNWGFGRRVNGWAGMTDWKIPLGSRLELSGELYRGRANGGIGGGAGRSVYFDSNPSDPSSQVFGVDSFGGWSQLKFKATSKLEFNAAFGLDNPTASEARSAFSNQSYPQQNRSALTNFIYRPRSNLLFSAEYRHLRTAQIYGDDTAEQINVMMGVLF
jgi:hypothetical protein